MSRAVDQVSRRTWDLAAYEAQATEQAAAAAETPAQGRNVPSETLRAAKRRSEQVDFAAAAAAPRHADHGGGFLCSMCDVVLRDSSSYLSHINGKAHQKALGNSVRSERATLAQVVAKLAELRALIRPPAPSSSAASQPRSLEVKLEEYDRKVVRRREERAEARRERKAAKRAKLDRQAAATAATAPAAPPDAEQAVMHDALGFSSFK